ncbi:MAG: ribonuclease HII [Minwuia sp.]|uniref:ribonuclease HII n=1 Tax=Minwuia sp. TaxID=2493630 RepID=UPI003A86197D
MIGRAAETEARRNAGGPVAGLDEAGRGPIAGPVVAAAVILPEDFDCTGLDDSKKLSGKRREALAGRILLDAKVGVGICTVEEIDELNILWAAMLAMRRAAEALPLEPAFALVDGNRIPPELPCAAEALVKGDGREACIAAASIVAKTHRDKIMCELDLQYPGYGLGGHAGYPTPAHKKALLRLGPSPVHRRSFRPVRDMFT